MEEQNPTGAVSEGDIPKRTVLVLLVITIIVVALGTWTVLERMSYAPSSGIAKPSSVAGQVSLTILPNEEASTTTAPETAG